MSNVKTITLSFLMAVLSIPLYAQSDSLSRKYKPYEPGTDASSTIWGTGNQGTFMIGNIATVPYDRGEGNKAARLITLDTGVPGSKAGAPLAAGSIYTGVFNFDNQDPSDPEAAIELGTPFTGRPVRLQFSYAYVTGDSINYALPTHITFVASSSYDGAHFAGAEGSEMLLDDVVLMYE